MEGILEVDHHQHEYKKDRFDGGGQEDRNRYALIGAVESVECGATSSRGGVGCHRLARGMMRGTIATASITTTAMTARRRPRLSRRDSNSAGMTDLHSGFH